MPNPWSNQVIQPLLIIQTGAAGTGIFVYNGAPSASNPPIVSITQETTDPYGNAVLAGGVASYGVDGTSFLADGEIQLAPTQAAINGNYAAFIDGAVAGQSEWFSGGTTALDNQASIVIDSQNVAGATHCSIQAAKTVINNSGGATPVSHPASTVAGIIAAGQAAGIWL